MKQFWFEVQFSIHIGYWKSRLVNPLLKTTTVVGVHLARSFEAGQNHVSKLKDPFLLRNSAAVTQSKYVNECGYTFYSAFEISPFLRSGVQRPVATNVHSTQVTDKILLIFYIFVHSRISFLIVSMISWQLDYTGDFLCYLGDVQNIVH